MNYIKELLTMDDDTLNDELGDVTVDIFREKLSKAVLEIEKRPNTQLKTDAQGAGCPHCGHYCAGKTVFCTPPINRAAD